MCGEKTNMPELKGMSVGSPPHVRGKVGQTAARNQAERITPACAGKSHFATNFHLNKRDHPRMCGEKSHSVSPAVAAQGSPPHVRGKD